MNVYEKLIIFIKSLIFDRFWWKKCQTIGLKVFWVDLRNQNLSKIDIWIGTSLLQQTVVLTRSLLPFYYH